jgi:hypothetical protein
MNPEVEQVDEFHGIGGAYVFENGVRRRVEEPTKDHPEGNAPRDHKGRLIEFAPGVGLKKPPVMQTVTAEAPKGGKAK